MRTLCNINILYIPELPLSTHFPIPFNKNPIVGIAMMSNNNDANKASLLLQQSIASVEAKQILENIKSDEILQFASRHYAPDVNKNIMPVAYQPQWLPRGFNTDDRLNNRFINRANKKEFSIFIDSPNTLNLPDGVYKKENFILIKKTLIHSDKPHTIAIFGDIDIESGKRILNSIRPIK